MKIHHKAAAIILLAGAFCADSQGSIYLYTHYQRTRVVNLNQTIDENANEDPHNKRIYAQADKFMNVNPPKAGK